MNVNFAPNIAPVAALIGDPARAAMLMALMGGRALTMSELGSVAGLAKATASAHLRQLQQGGLITTRSAGRHKYVTLASPGVAALIEALMGLASDLSTPVPRVRTGPRDPAMRIARLCYDHLAGARGVQIFDHLVRTGQLAQTTHGLALTETGTTLLTTLGVTLPATRTRNAPVCRACLDWSERTSHLAGPVARALLHAFEDKRWLIRTPGSRVLTVTPSGAAALDRIFPAASPRSPLDAARGNP
jgi:DNA-binding transcriptional ArsR family regulator/ribosomal protein S19E (S16A)